MPEDPAEEAYVKWKKCLDNNTHASYLPYIPYVSMSYTVCKKEYEKYKTLIKLQ